MSNITLMNNEIRAGFITSNRCIKSFRESNILGMIPSNPYYKNISFINNKGDENISFAISSNIPVCKTQDSEINLALSLIYILKTDQNNYYLRQNIIRAFSDIELNNRSIINVRLENIYYRVKPARLYQPYQDLILHIPRAPSVYGSNSVYGQAGNVYGPVNPYQAGNYGPVNPYQAGNNTYGQSSNSIYSRQNYSTNNEQLNLQWPRQQGMLMPNTIVPTPNRPGNRSAIAQYETIIPKIYRPNFAESSIESTTVEEKIAKDINNQEPIKKQYVDLSECFE